MFFLSQLNVRGKNKKEKLGGLFKGLAKGVDEVLLSSQKVDKTSCTNRQYLLFMTCNTDICFI